jgi:hypothetical protein
VEAPTSKIGQSTAVLMAEADEVTVGTDLALAIHRNYIEFLFDKRAAEEERGEQADGERRD